MQNKMRDDELVMNLVEMALARPGHERKAYLESACGSDSTLFNQTWSYVQWEQRMDGFLSEPLYSLRTDERPFEPGEFVEGRFRIVREVAKGGMGIVYEAIDRTLQRRIAIKCAKKGFHKRLPPEVRHASDITHRNVCKIFDIHTTVKDGGEIDFITMEYLEGQTLSDWIRRGPVPQQEARAIARQLCDGLAEAHRNHVIHGDLKSNNVILATGPDGGIRAVITDFGLARRPEGAPCSGLLEEAGGTPGYMAPELESGKKPSVASDIYALGVILYEMVSGRRPPEPEASGEGRTARKPPPVHPKWDRILARCLDEDPGQRYGSVAELAKELEPPDRRWMLIPAATLMAIVAVVLFVRPQAPQETVRLALLPLKSDAETAPLARSVLYDTSERLSRVKPGRIRLTVIPAQEAVGNQVDEPEKAAGKLGATHALTGTLRKENGLFSARIHLVDTHSHIRLKEWKAEYKPDELRNMPMALAGMVTGSLGLSPLAGAQSVNATAYADYWAGSAALSRGSSARDEAIRSLERAAAADPQSPLTHAKLAEAEWRKYLATGDLQWARRAQASLQKAEQRNPDVAAVRLVSGIVHDHFGQYGEAHADFRRAVELEPTNGEIYRQIGNVYEDHNQLNEALGAYLKALEVQPEYFGNYRVLGLFYFRKGDYEEAARQYRKMVELAPDLPDSHYRLATPYLNMGRYAEAEAKLHTANNYQETANAVEGLGLVRVYQGQVREAIPFFQRALEIGPKVSLFYINLGTALLSSGLPRESEQAYRNGLAVSLRELAINPANAYERSCVAYLLARLGERLLAESDAEQAMRSSGGANNVRWMVALTYEALQERSRTLDVIRDAPDWLFSRLNRLPDLADLQRDPDFQLLLRGHHVQ